MKGKAGQLGQQLLDKTKQMFNWWEKIRDGTLSRGLFRKRMQPIRVEVKALLIDGELLGVRPMAGKCAQITARIISRNQNTAQYY